MGYHLAKDKLKRNDQLKLIEDIKKRFGNKTIKKSEVDLEKEFGVKRFYCNIFISGMSSEIQVDSGADVSVISKGILKELCPKWQELENAEKIELSGVTGTKLNVIASKIIPVSFLPGRNNEFRHPFIVIRDPGQFLLSSHAMYQQSLGIRWEKRSGKPFLTWNDRQGTPREIMLHSRPRFTMGYNSKTFELQPGESQMIQFQHEEQEDECRMACVTNPGNQLRQLEGLRELLVVPSLSEVEGREQVSAMVKNFSRKAVRVPKGHLLADVEIEREGGEFQILEEPGPNETMEIEEEELSVLPARKIISHLPIRVRRGLRKYESDLSREVLGMPLEATGARVSTVKKFEGKSREKTTEEKHDLLREIFPLAEDMADLRTEPGSELGFEIAPPRSVWEQFDFTSVPPQYRPFIRWLLQRHENLFSTSDLDCGDISATLGTYTLPLRKPLPHTSHRTYYMQGNKQSALKTILSLMLRHGLIKRVKSASFSSPVFLIEKKDKASLPRLLADVRQLNDHLNPVHQLVPKIQSLLENIGNMHPVLFSNMDLASAFSV